MSQNKAKQNATAEIEPTNADILGAINQFATQVEERFDKIESTMATKTDLAAAVQRIDAIENKLDSMVTKDELKDNLAAMETRLVTKDYLDKKLYDLKGDLTVVTRQEDHKVNKVVGLLHQKNIFSAQEAAEVLSTAVFPKPIS